MPLHPLPYKAALPLVRKHLCLDEDPKTAMLIGELLEARRRGYLRPSELEAILSMEVSASHSAHPDQQRELHPCSNSRCTSHAKREEEA